MLAAVKERKSGMMNMSTLCDRAWGARGEQDLMYSAVFSRSKYILRDTPTVLLLEDVIVSTTISDHPIARCCTLTDGILQQYLIYNMWLNHISKAEPK